MNQETIEKLLKLPNNDKFNWNLYDKNKKLTVDYKSIFNENDFETLINIIKDTNIWVENEKDYKLRIEKTGISELQHIHCFRTLALYKKEEVIDLFLAIYELPTDNIDSHLYLEEFIPVFMEFSDNQKVVERLFGLFSAPMTNKNNVLQGITSEFFEQLYKKTSIENQAVIEKLWIDKLEEEVSDENNIDCKKETLNSFIINELLKVNLAGKHYELIKELMEDDLVDTLYCGSLDFIEVKLGMRDASTLPKQSSIMDLFTRPQMSDFSGSESYNFPISPASSRVAPKATQKKNKNKKKTAKASKKKNRK